MHYIDLTIANADIMGSLGEDISDLINGREVRYLVTPNYPWPNVRFFGGVSALQEVIHDYVGEDADPNRVAELIASIDTI